MCDFQTFALTITWIPFLYIQTELAELVRCVNTCMYILPHNVRLYTVRLAAGMHGFPQENESS